MLEVFCSEAPLGHDPQLAGRRVQKPYVAQFCLHERQGGIEDFFQGGLQVVTTQQPVDELVQAPHGIDFQGQLELACAKLLFAGVEFDQGEL